MIIAILIWNLLKVENKKRLEIIEQWIVQWNKVQQWKNENGLGGTYCICSTVTVTVKS